MFALLLVFGARAGRHAAEESADSASLPMDPDIIASEVARVKNIQSQSSGTRPGAIRQRIQRATSPTMIAKDETSLRRALSALAGTQESDMQRLCLQAQPDLFEALSVTNLMEVATILMQAALLRKESRGPHYRMDFPEECDDQFGQNLIWRSDGGTLKFRWGKLYGPPGTARAHFSVA